MYTPPCVNNEYTLQFEGEMSENITCIELGEGGEGESVILHVKKVENEWILHTEIRK